jgi:hypothetical protein
MGFACPDLGWGPIARFAPTARRPLPGGGGVGLVCQNVAPVSLRHNVTPASPQHCHAAKIVSLCGSGHSVATRRPACSPPCGRRLRCDPISRPLRSLLACWAHTSRYCRWASDPYTERPRSRDRSADRRHDWVKSRDSSSHLACRQTISGNYWSGITRRALPSRSRGWTLLAVDGSNAEWAAVASHVKTRRWAGRTVQ